ncbi:MAG: AAA family ATPase [Phycisphaerales bacterium]
MNPNLPDLILLKGAPGVGKSTAAKLLAQHFPSGVRIEVDTLRQMVISVDWTNQAEHRKLLTLSAQLATGFLRSGFSPVILVDTFSGDKIDGFLTEFHAQCPSKRACAIVLHAAEDVLRERLSNREAGGFRDIDISMRINSEAVRDARPSERVLDTSSLSPTDVMGAILRITGEPSITGEHPLTAERSCSTVRNTTSRLSDP